jgi:FlaA1/EpsC-like NDP-sugar epimerase
MVLDAVSENKSEYEKLEKNIHKGINLFGAGRVGQSSMDFFIERKYKIGCFLDNSPEKQNKIIRGINVKKINELSEGVVMITVSSVVANAEIKASLETNLPVMSFALWFIIKNIQKFEYFRNNVFLEEISKMYLTQCYMRT